MEIKIFPLALAFCVLALHAVAYGAELCQKPWICERLVLNTPTSGQVKIRAGYYPESADFKGNILYFEGLGDSMLNHDPLFSQLSDEGYRVIAFDYMGQGGSAGKMNDTRIKEIPLLGDAVWKKYARELERFPSKTIIGWSTGGLAAYYEAHQENADQVVLIAPGIAPNKVVGEQDVWNLKFNQITLESLTTARYPHDGVNPHRDRVRPSSPLQVPLFALNLLSVACESRSWSISKNVRGFVLLSGSNDTYVNARLTRRVLKGAASHFMVKTYARALHEIDNEAPEISEQARKDIVAFIKNLN